MSLITRLSLASMLVAASTTYAAELEDGWYAGLNFGASHLNNINLTFVPSAANLLIFPPFPAFTGKLNYKTGFIGGGQIGYRLCHNFRLEGELIYGDNNIDEIRVPGVGAITRSRNALGLSINGDTTLMAGLFNAYYDFHSLDSDSNVAPYLGLGIGYGHVQTKFDLEFIGTDIARFKESSSEPLLQGIVGISYYFNDIFSVGLDFRYLTTNELNGRMNDNASLETLNLNFNYSFD